MHKQLLLAIAIVVLFTQLIQCPVAARKRSFSVELIHRDSPLSPFFNSSRTRSELLREAALCSMDRAKHLRSFMDGKSIESVVIPNGGAYVMKISVGTPPVEFLAVADTGSDLVWVQCKPCDQCYKQENPLFDPQASSTYSALPCSSQPCQFLGRRHTCGEASACEYSYEYGDGSYTIGVLSNDTFSFQTSNGQTASFPASLFGCGHENNGRFNSHMNGIVGLGGGPLSLIRQLGNEIDHRFSYCLTPRSTSSSSKLRFGQEATITGQDVLSTPIITKNPPAFYYLTLEGISIGSDTARATSSQGNIIIDSGTTITMLETSLYSNLEALVTNAIGLNSVQESPFSLCYQTGSAINIPDMVFHFSGADITLKALNTFVVLDDLTCMAIVPTESLSIFGNIAQVNFQVGYDLQSKQVSFAPADCTNQ